MRLKALSNINHSGTVYVVGEIFEIDEETAVILIDSEVADDATGEEIKTPVVEVQAETPVETPIVEAPVVTPTEEAPVIETPLVQQEPEQAGTEPIENAPTEPLPALKNEGVQPTASQISKTVEALETSLPDVHIS